MTPARSPAQAGSPAWEGALPSPPGLVLAQQQACLRSAAPAPHLLTNAHLVPDRKSWLLSHPGLRLQRVEASPERQPQSWPFTAHAGFQAPQPRAPIR